MAKSKKKRKAPSAKRKTQVMGEGVRKAMANAMDAVKRTEQAKAQAELKAFAAKMIVHIAKEAGIKGPPWSEKTKVMAKARKKAEKMMKDAQKKVAKAKKEAYAMQKAASKKTA